MTRKTDLHIINELALTRVDGVRPGTLPPYVEEARQNIFEALRGYRALTAKAGQPEKAIA
jgi:hypothetical protein